MASTSRKTNSAVRTLLALQRKASRYTYFVIGDPETGYAWQLYAGDDVLCSSNVFASKKDCLKNIRAMQRHATTEDVRDDARDPSPVHVRDMQA